MKVNDAKNIIKQNPSILLKTPRLIFYLPIIVTKAFINNLQLNQETVYFVETRIADFLDHNALLIKATFINKNFHLKQIANIESFNPFLSLRLEEDLSINLLYKTILIRRFLDNAEAFVLFQKSVPVGYIFIQKGNVTITQVKTTLLQPKRTFSFIDLYIFKGYRNKKYHEILYFLTVNKLAKEGYKDFWCWLMKHNQISIKAHVKIGINNVTKIITRKSFFFLCKTKIKNQKLSLSQLIEY